MPFEALTALMYLMGLRSLYLGTCLEINGEPDFEARGLNRRQHKRLIAIRSPRTANLRSSCFNTLPDKGLPCIACSRSELVRQNRRQFLRASRYSSRLGCSLRDGLQQVLLNIGSFDCSEVGEDLL